jgi:hypothetical protein
MKKGFVIGAIAGTIGGIAAFVFTIIGFSVGFYQTGIRSSTLDIATIYIILNIIWGSIFGAIYSWFYDYIPRKGMVKGIIFGLIIWLLAGVRPQNFAISLFSYSGAAAYVSTQFLTQVVYGLVLGLLYRKPPK